MYAALIHTWLELHQAVRREREGEEAGRQAQEAVAAASVFRCQYSYFCNSEDASICAFVLGGGRTRGAGGGGCSSSGVSIRTFVLVKQSQYLHVLR